MSNNYIDIHSHVLWDIDDGSKDVYETINLCDMACSSGTSDLFVTPHLIYWENSGDLLDERDWKCEKLSEILEDEEIDLKIHKGFEILCDDEIFEIKYFKPYTLCGSRYILIEFDFFKTSVDDVLSWCSYLITFGLVPVIAHPERYQFFLSEEKAIDELSKKGVLFQINSGSAAGMFGSRVKSFAEKMINKGYADFIGSDAHDLMMRNTDIDFCLDNYEELDTENLERILYTNPMKIINDEQIEVHRFGEFAEN
ncbi:MAG: CpsB/CapC family capsule biosynthesis tyrosine phosphatase [Acutalibacteraceae bacterium]|nr:CpsB/CapC family capsule biosynthesis tyrosine phosphatase [Acutalibacteraceae bacterium]